MHSPAHKRWIKLSFLRLDAAIHVRYEDGLGVKLKTDNTVIQPYAELNDPTGILFSLPPGINESIKKVAASWPYQRSTPKGFQQIPISVYCEGPDAIEFLRYRFATHSSPPVYFFPESFLPALRECQYQVCYLNSLRFMNPFKLPVNVRFAGPVGEQIQHMLKNRNWYSSNPNVDSHGLTFGQFTGTDIPADTDIMVVNPEYLPGVVSELTRPGFDSDVRLIITPGSASWMTSGLTMYGCPVLFVNDQNSNTIIEFIVEFFYGIIHDFALHEAVYWANEKIKVWDLFFCANEISNHGLHLSDALDNYLKEVKAFSKVINPGNKSQFINKFINFPPGVVSQLNEHLADESIKQLFDSAGNLGFHFHGESTGLVPMSNEHKKFSELKMSLEKIKSGLEGVLSDVNVANALTEKQERRVDVTIDQLNDALVFEPAYKMYPLIEGREYRLNVEIGQPSNFSLMAGKIESIDALLPDPSNENGHELEVVVFEKDFILESSNVCNLHLPRFGGTDRVSFYIVAPRGINVAELRIMIFHGNNLLQSFLLKAEILPETMSIYSRVSQDPAIKVTMDVSTSSHFTNLNKLKPRDLYLGMNENSSGTHTVFIKGGVGGNVGSVNDAIIGKEQIEFASILQTSYFDGNEVRFNSSNLPGSQKDEAYYNVIKDLANFGNDFYRKINRNVTGGLADALEKIKRSENKSIQAANLMENNFFPWSVVYDYTVPPSDGRKYPLCTGQKFSSDEYLEFFDRGFGCPHNPDIRCYCEQGFWGIRHKIEQILPGPTPKDAVDEVDSKRNIMYSCNVADDWTSKILDLMTTRSARIITGSDNLIDLLWDEAERPISLIVFGHMETVPGNPKEGRILTFTETSGSATPAIFKKFIYSQLLDQYRENKQPWKSPRSIVFLINCKSNEFQIDKLNTIVGSFWSAGASAIISTNCNIATGLGKRFIEEMIKSLYDDKMELGDALQKFNKEMFESGVPLPFIFTCFGNINMSIK